MPRSFLVKKLRCFTNSDYDSLRTIRGVPDVLPSPEATLLDLRINRRESVESIDSRDEEKHEYVKKEYVPLRIPQLSHLSYSGPPPIKTEKDWEVPTDRHSDHDNYSPRPYSPVSSYSPRSTSPHSDVYKSYQSHLYSASFTEYYKRHSSPQSEARSPRLEAKSTYSYAKSPRLEAKIPYSEARSPYSRAKSPHSEAKLPYSDARLPHLEARSSYSRAKSPHSEAKSPYSDTRSPHFEAKSRYSDTRSPLFEPRPAHSEARLPHHEARSPLSEVRRPSNESRPQQYSTKLDRSRQSSPLYRHILPDYQSYRSHSLSDYRSGTESVSSQRSDLCKSPNQESAGPTSDTEAQEFQNGVTVGYTYDAFFISDGRSKRKPPEPAESPKLSKHRYVCSECGKDYATSSNLSRHKQTHRSLDSQLAKKCPHCEKRYVSMPALSMHILTHELKHVCPMCDKKFSRPWLLQGHLRSHSGEKPYGCAHCGKAFADRSNLRAHMQTHSKLKSHECNKCHKSFALKSYLNKHLESACLRDGECASSDEGIEMQMPEPMSTDSMSSMVYEQSSYSGSSYMAE